MDWVKEMVDKDVGGDNGVEDDETIVVGAVEDDETIVVGAVVDVGIDICVVSVDTMLDNDSVGLMVLPNARLVEINSVSLVLDARTWSGDEVCTIDTAGATLAVVDEPRFRMLHIFLNTTLVAVSSSTKTHPSFG